MTVQDEEAPAGPGTPTDDDDLYVPTSWELMEVPSTELVKDKLATLPDWFGGIKPADYVEYVQPLGQDKNVSLVKGQKDYRKVWTLYVTVAGRIRMLNDAAAINDWRVDFIPEPDPGPDCPTGYVQFDHGDVENGRIVYREYVEISVWLPDLEGYRSLGRKSGTAWVPSTGGAQAVGSNRFEKVETSARGRAIAAWGIGIVPGSGVASFDEMRDAAGLAIAEAAGTAGVRRRRAGPTPRPEREEALRETLVEYQQLSGLDVEEVDEKVQAYVKSSFDKEVSRTDGGPFDWTPLKDGELGLLHNQMKKGVEKFRNQDPNTI